MTFVVVPNQSVGARFAVMLGAISLGVACGGAEPSGPPASGGSAGSGGTSTVTGGLGGSSGVSGAPGSGGTTAPTGGASGASSGGASSGGATSGGTGATDSGAGGMNGGTAGTAGGSAGMSGSPPMGGAGAGGTGSPGGSGGARALSFRADIYPVFDMIRDPVFVYPGGSEFESCTTGGVCHGGQTPGAGLRMNDANEAYSQLMNVPSTTDLCAGTTRVIAGNPAQSCLILFYEGRLRNELDWVDTAEIDLVRRWISEGALP